MKNKLFQITRSAISFISIGYSFRKVKITILSIGILSIGFYTIPIVVADVTTGLVGSWGFEEGSGTTAADASGNGYTGNLINGTTWTTGQIGTGALAFDGTNDYLDLNAAALSSANMTARTVSMRVKWNSVDSNRNIFTDAIGSGWWRFVIGIEGGGVWGQANLIFN